MITSCNKSYFWLLAFPCLLWANGSQADYASFAEGDAALSSGDPSIPEPLLFDLVRPLGAKKGELEINTLAEQSLEGGSLNWAPEIEYAFADGYAVELELPFQNSSLTDFKVAMQGTLGTLAGGRMIHGWQVIARKARDGGNYSGDALYLNGYRFTDKWSMLNMVGIRRTEFGGNGEVATLLNNSLFYDYSQRLTYGIEINSEIDRYGSWRYRFIPQIHYDLGAKATVQLGGGFSRLNQDKEPEKLLALRLIYAF